MTVLIKRNRADFLQLNHCVFIFTYDAGISSSVGSHTTGVERTQCQLSTRLTNSLSCNHTNSLTLLYHAACSKVTTVTFHANTLLRLTGEHGTDLDALNLSLLNSLCDGLGNFLTSLNDDLTGLRIDDIMDRHTAKDTLRQAGDNLITTLQG